MSNQAFKHQRRGAWKYIPHPHQWHYWRKRFDETNTLHLRTCQLCGLIQGAVARSATS